MTISLGEFFKRFLLILLILLFVLGMLMARSSLILGFLAAVVAVGISIPSRFLQRLGLWRGWAIFIATLVVNVLFIFLMLLIVPALIYDIGQLLSSVPDATSSVFSSYESLRESNAFLAANLPSLRPLFEGATEAQVLAIDQGTITLFINQIFNASLAVARHVLGGMNTLFAVALNFAFVLFVAVFFLVDPKSYVKASLFLMPQRYHARAVVIWNELYQTLITWITGQLLSGSITVGLVWLIMGLLLQMPHSLVVAIFAGMATFRLNQKNNYTRTREWRGGIRTNHFSKPGKRWKRCSKRSISF
ncbi:AI-2E family transporter [Chloroflexi bacterium TSY]|nr:AI-2E family transporter [Chloroflexi bacterium TSY]